MKYIKCFEKYTPTMSKFDKTVNKNPNKYTDSDFNYKIGDFVKILNLFGTYNSIPSKSNLDSKIYEIINRFKDKGGVDHYRLKSVESPHYMDEYWQVEKNKRGEPQFEILSKEESEEYELKRDTKKYNL